MSNKKNDNQKKPAEPIRKDVVENLDDDIAKLVRKDLKDAYDKRTKGKN